MSTRDPATGLSQTLIEVEPITSHSDIPTLAAITDLALKSDGYHEFQARYAASPIYETTHKKLTEALDDDRKRYHMFKAVSIPTSDADGPPVIVGYTQWRLGYVETPKMDPFARSGLKTESKGEKSSFEADVSNVTISEDIKEELTLPRETVKDASTSSLRPKPFYSNPDEELSRKVGNAYISAMRGKRHLYLHRLIVHPEYQRQGIGQKLLDWGVETADRENVVTWLFSRPAGSKLYEKNGWRTHCVIEVDTPDEDLEVAPLVGMQRLPRQTRNP